VQVSDIITPLIAAIWGGSFFGDLYFTINHSKFLYGDFLNQVITTLTFHQPHNCWHQTIAACFQRERLCQ
jgi:hypothetical protein